MVQDGTQETAREGAEDLGALGRLDGEGPVWQQIRRAVAAPILSGTWPPGHRIPNESALITHYGVARMTVHRAVRSLASEGLVARRRRRGTVVATGGPERPVFEIWNVREEIERGGRAYAFEILSRAILGARDPGARDLAAPGSGETLALSGLHLADGVPVEFEERLVNLAAAPEAVDRDFAAEPPGSWLLTSVAWSEAEHAVEAREATAPVAAALGLRRGAACLVVERRTWQGATAVIFARLWRSGATGRLVGRFRPGGA